MLFFVVTNMHNIRQKSLKKRTAEFPSWLHFCSRDFMLLEKTGESSPFTHCSLCAAQGEPLCSAPTQGKPCSTWEWPSNGNWSRPSSCRLPETFSLHRTFLSILSICFRGPQVREVIRKVMRRNWEAPEWVASLLFLPQPFCFRN